jgi:hypothetical protein
MLSSINNINVIPTFQIIACSPTTIHPAPFFQHFELNELKSTFRTSLVLETLIASVQGFEQYNEDGSDATALDKTTAVVSGTMWRFTRALSTGTTLRILEQVLILGLGAKLFSDVFLEDAADASRDTESSRDNGRSELVARATSSSSAVLSGIRSSGLYHVSVAVIGVCEYYLNNYLRHQKKNKKNKKKKNESESNESNESNDEWKINEKERKEWNIYIWKMCGWSTLTTGIGAGIGTFVAPGFGTAVGRLIGMNIIYFTATPPKLR